MSVGRLASIVMPDAVPRRFDAFLSYNSQDRPAVEELAERLRGEGLVLYLENGSWSPVGEFQPGSPRP